MARKDKFEDIDEIMGSAAMAETDTEEIFNEIIEVTLSKITDNPYQPRLEMKNDDLIELSNSIVENGLLQPILLNKIDNKKYQVIAGHRRLAAHRFLKYKSISAIVVSKLEEDTTEYKKTMAISALVENLQRKDLDVLETAIAFQNLLNEKIYDTKDKLAKATGKTNAYVSKILSVLKLDSEIIRDLELNKSIKDIEALYELQKINDAEIQLKLYEELVKGKLSRNELREYNKKNMSTDKKEKITQKNSNVYKIEKKKETITIKYNTSKLSDDKKTSLNDEIVKIFKRYF